MAIPSPVRVAGGIGPTKLGTGVGAVQPSSSSGYDPYMRLIQDQVPSLYWRFDETETGTTARDSSGNGRNGTHVNALMTNAPPLLTGGDGRNSRSAEYIAASLYRTTSTYAPFVNSTVRTFTWWANRTSTTASRAIFGNDVTGTTELRYHSGGAAVQFYYDQSVSATASATWNGITEIANGLTHHCALIVDQSAGTVELYVNGVSKGVITAANSTSWNATAGNLKVGAVGTGATDPFDGFIDDFAVFERRLTRNEIHKQYVIGSTYTQGDGGQATGNLNIPPPPDTTGYTVYTLTAAESAPMRGVYRITLDNNTDYLIYAPHKIQRPIQFLGGRNIVCKDGMHIQISYQGRIPDGGYTSGLSFRDNGNAVNRVIHFEGLWIDGDDLMEAIDPNCATAELRFGYLRLGSPQHPIIVRGSDLLGIGPNPDTGFGRQPYSSRGWQHPDGIQPQAGGYRNLYIDRMSLFTAQSGLNLDEAPSTSLTKIRKTNIQAGIASWTEEGPYTFGSSFTPGTTIEDWEVSLGSWVAASSATVTRNTATPITGVGSMQIARNAAFRQAGAVISYGTSQNFGASGTALRLKARLDSGGGSYPMIRVDLATDSTVDTATSSTLYGWHHGDPTKLVNGSTVDVVSNYPAEVLAAVRKIRIVIMKDNTNDNFVVNVDDLNNGVGDASITYAGPNLTLEGSWAIHRLSSSGPLKIEEMWIQQRANNTFAGGTSYAVRYWDTVGLAYVLDPPPGNATLTDFVAGTGMGHTTGSDGISNYITPTDSGVTSFSGGAAIIREGVPDDYAPVGVPGINYVSPGVYDVNIYPPIAAATAAVTAPVPQVSITAVAATAMASSVAPLPKVEPVAVPATATASNAAPLPTLSVTAPAATATASSVAPAPRVDDSDSPPAAAATASVSAPTPALAVTATAAAATASAPTPNLQLDNNLTIQAQPATATASVATPQVQTSDTDVSPASAATASAPAPTPALSVAPTAANATAAGLVPVLSVVVTATAANAIATSIAPTPAIAGVAPAASGTASAPSPGLAVLITASPAVASASVSAPTPSLDLQAAAAIAMASGIEPFVDNGSQTVVVAPAASAIASIIASHVLEASYSALTDWTYDETPSDTYDNEDVFTYSA